MSEEKKPKILKESKDGPSQSNTPADPVKTSGKKNIFKAFKVLVILALAVGVITLGLRFTHHNKPNSNALPTGNIKIGDVTITPTDIKTLSNQLSKYSKQLHNSLGGPAVKVAEDDLILNAALKDQAHKHNITVTQADLDSAIPSQSLANGKSVYNQYLKSTGLAMMTNVLNENKVYESKLENVVIAKKNLFVVGITYDAPYFNNSKDPAALRAQATKTLQTKFLPLFEKGESEAQIAAQTDLNFTGSNNPAGNPNVFFTSMPTEAWNNLNCTTATPCFNDAQVGHFASIPGIVSTASKVAQLTKVGQHTNVYTFKAGFIGIIQLTGQTPGAYNSWDQLTRSYKKQYAPQLTVKTEKARASSFAALARRAIHGVAGLAKAVGSLILPAKAYADPSECYTNGSHYAEITYHAYFYNEATGVVSSAPGAWLQESRPSSVCSTSGGFYVDDSGQPGHRPNRLTTNGSGTATDEDNCYTAPPYLLQRAPSAPSGFSMDGLRSATISASGVSYTVGSDSEFGNQFGPAAENNTGSDIYRLWAGSLVNNNGGMNISITYNIQPHLPTWNLNGGSGGPNSVVPGQSVTFSHSVTNQGPDTANYSWHVQGSYGGGSGSYSDVGVSGSAGSVPPGGTNPNTANSTVTPWPGNTSASDGSRYCQRIVYTNASGPGTGSSTSGPVCATLNRPSTPVFTCTFTWVPEPYTQAMVTPPEDPPTGRSWGGSGNIVGTGALVTISGTNASPASYWQGQTVSPTVDYAPYTANYQPISPNISITVQYYENAITHTGNIHVYELLSTTTTNLNCYSATANTSGGACSLSISGGQGPGGAIIVGQSVHVTGTIYNYPDPSNPNKITLPGTAPDGHHLSLTMGGEHDVGYDVPVGATTAPIDLGNIGANGGPNPSTQTISAYPDYYGTGPIGPTCSISFPVYAPFTLDPHANVILYNSKTSSRTSEHPDQVINDTWVTETGAAVTENASSHIYELPAAGGNINHGNTGNGGPFSPGSTTCLYEGPPPNNVPGCAPLNNGVYPPNPLAGGDTYCADISVEVNTLPGNQAYVGPGGDKIGGGPDRQSTCPAGTPGEGPGVVENKPFFKVNNGTVSAGGAFKSATPSCTGGGTLGGWNDNTGINPAPGDYGAGTQIGALALGPTVGVASHQSAFGNSPTALSFANTIGGDKTVDPYSPKLGGDFNPGGANCFTEVIPPPPGPDFTNYPSSHSFPFGIGVPVGHNITVFVTGDVYIGGNVTYAGGGWSVAGNGNVPSFVLHATGNIYIGKDVTELDGLYESTGGKIYTCGTAYAAMPLNQLYGNCNKQLSVYGSFVANQVNMMRTFGSLRDDAGIPGVGGSPGVTGVTSPLIWSYGGPDPPPGSGYTCTPVHEFSPPQDAATSWNDNQLCVRNDHPVAIGWTTDATSPEYPSNPSPQSRTGLPTCTASWGLAVAPYGYPHDNSPGHFWWDDNYLCSAATTLSFSISPSNPSTAAQSCANVIEPSDPYGGGLFQNVNPAGRAWICISNYAAGSGATAAHPPYPEACSNGAGLVVNTCAAEVFYSTPELYLSTPNIGKPSNGAPQWDSVTSLPPLL